MSRRAVRVPDALWARAQAKADENDEYLSEVIRRALESYVISESTKKEKQ
jgi:hypothetical protein